MLGQMPQEDVLVCLLKFTAEKSTHVLIVDVVLQHKKVVEDLNGI